MNPKPCPATSPVRLPWITLALSAAAGAVLLVPGWSEALVYDRAAIVCGEAWRFFTGHLAHWNFDHLLWDLLMFALLGAMIERRGRRLLAATLVLSATAISATLFCGQPEVATYRGLSGIDSALFTCLAVELFRSARQQRQTPLAVAIVVALVGFVGKIGYEMATGATLFVDSAAAGFTPLPLVHAVGGACGLLAALGRLPVVAEEDRDRLADSVHGTVRA